VLLTSSLSDLYEADYLSWIEQTVQLLKQGKLSELDMENLIEEVEELARSEKRELRSRLRVLLMHLLKWQYQPDRRAYPETSNLWNQNSWASTISEQRDSIEDLLTDSPSLRNFLSETLSDSYKKARENAAQETGIELAKFPDSCPYSESQILSKDFWPE
jgi:DNA-directed RNA polymerase delta subunit